MQNGNFLKDIFLGTGIPGGLECNRLIHSVSRLAGQKEVVKMKIQAKRKELHIRHYI